MTDLIVVDVANVMGSRPDGWWRDRAGAAGRIYQQVLDARLEHVVLVVEGAARAGVAARSGRPGGVRVLHAPGSGDDEVVAAVTEAPRDATVTVVTSDRELRQRVVALGARVDGPRWFLALLG